MCEDKLSDSRPITVKDGDEDVVITSCSELVKCYPSVCETQGLIGGVCCQECKKVGSKTFIFFCLNHCLTSRSVVLEMKQMRDWAFNLS